jgi:two-component system response regulator ChvI
MSHKIALVDDDRNILTSVSMALEAEGFEVKTFNDGEEGLKGILEITPDLVVLDIKMPRLDGMEVLTRLREESRVPVIFLTSKDDEIDEIIGLRMGADDYITKPFSQRLLIERIRALLRRQSFEAAPVKTSDEDEKNKIIRGHLVLDDARHISLWKGEVINLTVTEYLLLKALALRPGHVKNRDQLIDMAYGENIYVDDRTIDSHIKRIRKKFRVADNEFNHIETLYGVGYKYKDESLTTP